nr:uncharacterized protein LOC121114906 [Lepeophtheirus salmonis]
MGNSLVPSFLKATNPSTNKIPSSLMDLLSNIPFQMLQDVPCESPVQNIYLQKFKEYLKKRNLKEEDNILSFIISYNIFMRKNQEIDSDKPKKTSQQIHNLKNQKKTIFFNICESFFNYENPDNLISLNTEVLMDELNNSLDLKNSDKEPNYSLLQKAIEDNSVKELETTFQQFMLQMGQKRTACLLSLL